MDFSFGSSAIFVLFLWSKEPPLFAPLSREVWLYRGLAVTLTHANNDCETVNRI